MKYLLLVSSLVSLLVSSKTQSGTASQIASPSTPVVPTASPSTPIIPTPSKSSARPSTSAPHNTTTTPKPQPTPSPTPVEFDYRNKTNHEICVAVKGTILLIAMIGGKSYRVQVAGNTTGINGNCSNGKTSAIYASWKNCMIGMEFKFLKDGSWFLRTIQAEVFTDKEHGDVYASSTFHSRRDDHLYQGPANQSYTCAAETKLVLNITGGKVGEGNITVDFRDLNIQPFPMKGPKFPNPKSCLNDSGSGGSSNSIVPIAVGCALAGLIVIVLIAYLIGRRKSNKGYQQV